MAPASERRVLLRRHRRAVPDGARNVVGRMPAKVLPAQRASVTAGAKEVDAVNQYAPVMSAPTAKGTADKRSLAHPRSRQQPEGRHEFRSSCATPALACTIPNRPAHQSDAGRITPRDDLRAEPRCTGHLRPGHATLPGVRQSVTAGLKCAPDIGPKVVHQRYQHRAVAEYRQAGPSQHCPKLGVRP